MSNHNCKHETDIAIIKRDVSEIKQDSLGMRKDIKNLLKFKWQIMGGAGATGVLIAYTIQLLSKNWG